MGSFRVAILTILITSSGCTRAPNGSSIDLKQAQDTSDAFIASLESENVDLVSNMMEPELAMGRTEARTFTRSVLEYCGHSKVPILKRNVTGSFLYADGRTKPMRRFYYHAQSDTNIQCNFIVEIVPNGSSLKVAKFRSLKEY